MHDGLIRGPNAQNDSKELRLRRALDKVQEIGSQLELGGRIIDAGQRYYKLAVYYNFVQGRSIQVVAAVCLYIACRKEETPYLLIDFSDILKVNMYLLGSVYMKLV